MILTEEEVAAFVIASTIVRLSSLFTGVRKGGGGGGRWRLPGLWPVLLSFTCVGWVGEVKYGLITMAARGAFIS